MDRCDVWGRGEILNRQKSFLAAALALALFAGSAGATPSTQIWIPSPDAQPFGTFHIGVDTYTSLLVPVEEGGRDLPTRLGLTVGLVETPFINLEVGAELREPGDDPWMFNMKVVLKEESVHQYTPAVAVGLYEFGTNANTTAYNILYGIVAKTIPVLGRVAGGGYFGNEERLKDSRGENAHYGFLVSWDRTLAEIDDRLWVAVDYFSGVNIYGAISFGAAWRFSPNISALAGYSIYNDTAVAGEHLFTFQIDIDL